jgi:cytochrome bd-type quinol oxidase subunit 1
MFMPAIAFFIVASLFAFRTYRAAQKRNWKDLGKGLVVVTFFLVLSIIFSCVLFIGKNDPRAWGVGPTFLCHGYGTC